MAAGTERSKLLDEHQFRKVYQDLRSTLPWDRSDRRGTLNHIGPAQVLAAAKEIELGVTVSLAAPIENDAAADNPEPGRSRVDRSLQWPRSGVRARLRHGPAVDECPWQRQQSSRRTLPRWGCTSWTTCTSTTSWFLSEAWGSFIQLILNVGVLIVVGAITLALQRRISTRRKAVARSP